MCSFVRMGHVVLFALLLAACGTSAPVSAPTPKLIEPGDTVGDVTLVKIDPLPTQATTDMTENCLGDTVKKPGVYDLKCPTSLGSMRLLGIGWSNESAKALEDDWSHMKWTAYLDGHEIDLKSFGTYDVTIGDYSIRNWNVAIKDTTPREYAIRVIFELQQTLTEGDTIYPVGTYDITNHVTVLKRVQ